MKHKHTLDQALKSLGKKNDCRIRENRILVLNGKSKKSHRQNDLGNGSWGKIDYLVKVHGYALLAVAEF
jgi:hypothetical protein